MKWPKNDFFTKISQNPKFELKYVYVETVLYNQKKTKKIWKGSKFA